ncbi:hypothetical protein WMF37_15785 [Sorangium sp. So ce291]|uniref:hypothetical protein n=1 Tax=Sorangium sp. So ce291 TaxID=3133294 RepID=UPI003F605F81
MSGGHGANVGAADRALVLMLLGTVLLVSPARLLWARGLLAVAAVFAVWVALIVFAALATRSDRADVDRATPDRGGAAPGDAVRGETPRADRELPP